MQILLNNIGICCCLSNILVSGPADVSSQEGPNDRLVDQDGLLLLKHQKCGQVSSKCYRKSWKSSSFQRWSELPLQQYLLIQAAVPAAMIRHPCTPVLGPLRRLYCAPGNKGILYEPNSRLDVTRILGLSRSPPSFLHWTGSGNSCIVLYLSIQSCLVCRTSTRRPEDILG